MNHHLRWDAGTHGGSAPIHLQPDGDDHTVTITHPDGTPILGLIRRPDGTITIGIWPDGEQWQPLTAGPTPPASDITDAIRKLIDEFWDKEKADYHDQDDDDRGYHPFDALTTLKAWLDKTNLTQQDTAR